MELYLLIFCIIMSLVFFVVVGLIVRQVIASKGIDTRSPFITWIVLGLATLFFIFMWVGYYIVISG